MRSNEEPKKMIIMAFTFILSRRKWVSHVQIPHKCWSFVFGAYVHWPTKPNGLRNDEEKAQNTSNSFIKRGRCLRVCVHFIIGHENGSEHIVSGTMGVLTQIDGQCPAYINSHQPKWIPISKLFVPSSPFTSLSSSVDSAIIAPSMERNNG